jgi:hypothetical protein
MMPVMATYGGGAMGVKSTRRIPVRKGMKARNKGIVVKG